MNREEEMLWNQEIDDLIDEVILKVEAEEDAKGATGEDSDSDHSKISHISLDEININLLNIEDRRELNLYSKIKQYKKDKEELGHNAFIVEALDAAIAAIKSDELPPVKEEIDYEKLKEEMLNDPRFPELAESNIGVQLTMLEIFDETEEFLTRVAMDKGEDLEIFYGCKCQADLDAKRLNTVLLHIALEHVEFPTSFEILFDFHTRLADNTRKSKKAELVCIACGYRTTMKEDLLTHFSTRLCCNIRQSHQKIVLDDINMEHLDTLIKAVDKETFLELMA